MVKRQHHGATGLAIEYPGHAVLDSPICAIDALQVKGIGVSGGVETKIVSVSDIVEVGQE